MAKYSKEQRDRAVDLYIRYERCAADVIHELGYPSRGMLPVRYRECLEEERAGRQSTRGKRYRRYTDEQKQAAVDHYLGHGRRLKRTMRALGYPKSHELLTAWIDELAPGRRKLRHGPVPEELKRKAVVAVASGGDAGAFLLEPVLVPHPQRAPAGVAELVYHVRGAVLVFDVQVHGPVTLLLAVLHHKGVLLPVEKSKKTSPPRFNRI